MENYISILGICVTVVVVAITSYFNQKESRQHQLFVEKLRIYTTYLQNVSESSVKNISEQKESDLLLRHIQAKQEMILFAPDNIVEVIGFIEPLDFTMNNQSQEVRDEKYDAYLLLLNLMRDDLSKSNKKVSKNNLRKLLG
jgi:hypothetical protein